MNYRHAFHAGNFADVLKHVVLTRLIEYLKRKDKAFRVIDTHAGPGLYNLNADEAVRTGEWRDGIARLGAATPAPHVAALLAPYFDAVKAVNAGQVTQLRAYPGSPLVSRFLLRKQDRLSVIELHPQDASRLKALFAGDFQVRVMELDGWLALGAHLPPKERRGLVLVDPPYEKEGEFARLVEGLVRAHRRWPGGIYALWYPIKDRPAVAAFRESVEAAGIPKILDVWQTLHASQPQPTLDGSGMIIVNPPYALVDEMRIVLPFLSSVLSRQPGAAFGIDWLSPEQSAA